MAMFLSLSSPMSVQHLVWIQSRIFKVWIAQRSCTAPCLSTAQLSSRSNALPFFLPSLFPKHRFHFHISAESSGSLRVLMQQAEGSEAILWSRSHNTGSHWPPEHLPVGRHQQPYKVWGAQHPPEHLCYKPRESGIQTRGILEKTNS